MNGRTLFLASVLLTTSAQADPQEPETTELASAKPSSTKPRKTKQSRSSADFKLLKRVRKSLPRGWRLQTRGLPKGVKAMVVGPKTKTGRAVVTLANLDGALPKRRVFENPKAIAYIKEMLGRDDQLGVIDLIKLDGPARESAPTESDEEAPEEALWEGWIEIGQKSPSKSPSGRVVRYLLGPERSPYLITIAAPLSSFQQTYRTLISGAFELTQTSNR